GVRQARRREEPLPRVVDPQVEQQQQSHADAQCGESIGGDGLGPPARPAQRAPQPRLRTDNGAPAHPTPSGGRATHRPSNGSNHSVGTSVVSQLPSKRQRVTGTSTGPCQLHGRSPDGEIAYTRTRNSISPGGGVPVCAR